MKPVRSLRVRGSLRSLRLALVSRCLPHSLRSLVQDSGAPAWLSTAERDSRRSQLICASCSRIASGVRVNSAAVRSGG
jgi:hypothetical protein